VCTVNYTLWAPLGARDQQPGWGDPCTTIHWAHPPPIVAPSPPGCLGTNPLAPLQVSTNKMYIKLESKNKPIEIHKNITKVEKGFENS
jgi:hypothetical protein